MHLMKNKYLNFETIDSGIGIVENTTTLGILPAIPEKYFTENYYILKKVENDRLLEALSWEIYENTNYWDILMVLNGMTTMNQLPVNFDVVMIRAERELEGWVKRGNLMYSHLSNSEIKEKYNEIEAEQVELNEKYRNIKYISPIDLSELLADLENVKNEVKINKNLIINGH